MERNMKLEEKLRRMIRQKGHAYNTEKAYLQKYNQFIQFTKVKYGEYRHPAELGKSDIQEFLTHLATDRNVASETQRGALSALKFLYDQVLDKDLGILDFAPADKPRKLPVVLTFNETSELLDQFSGITRIQSELMYGCGLRISDCLRLRVKDLDFNGNTIQVNDSKGEKNRLLMMPQSIKGALEERLKEVRYLFEQDRSKDIPGVWMPTALDEKAPSWGKQWGWFWVFPASKLAIDPRGGKVRRHHIGRDPYAKRMAAGKRKLAITKEVVPHTWRHTFATHMLLQGCDLRTLQRLLGHSSIKTTEIYLHVIEAMSGELVSPLDRLQQFADAETKRQIPPTHAKPNARLTRAG
jgi:integron integrase